VASGLLLLKLSASFLSVGGFAAFSQFMLFSALLNLLAVGGAQNGLIRQAAAAKDTADLARSQTAALMIWAVAAPGLALPVLAASGAVSQVLVGSAGSWAVVAAIAALALTAGPGQIWCSILSGRKRTASSLAAQALGLLAGTGGAAALIVRGQPAGAAIAFAGGGLVTMAAAFVLAARLKIPTVPWRRATGEVRILLRYSVALAATTGFTSIVLFGLRSLYREGFGATELGYWLAANRISDMSTQLLGLFMIQFFVPHLATTPDDAARRSLMLKCWVAGAGGMGAILAVFSVGARPLVRLFLSDAYEPAIGAIQSYMLGDMLRVWSSLAMFAAFARGRPGRYAAIEIGALAVMAAITSALIEAGQARAPFLGYIGAYGAAAAAVTVVFLLGRPRASVSPAGAETG
jgi:O-antigen/teichoic acid export membrane protein